MRAYDINRNMVINRMVSPEYVPEGVSESSRKDFIFARADLRSAVTDLAHRWATEKRRTTTMTDYDEAERDYWTSRWENANPKQRQWARSVSGKHMKAHELLTDDEGAPAGVRSTGGIFPRFAEMFSEDEETSR